MNKDTAIRHGAKLSPNDFNEMLNYRRRIIFKFNQLQEGMTFIIQDGHDDFENIITKVDYINKTFKYIDLSLPKESKLHNIEQTSEVLFVPRMIYFEGKQFIYRKYDSNAIFQLHNTTDFEKSLFDDLHIKALTTINNVQKKIIAKLKHELDNKVFESTPTKKMLNQATQIKYLLNKLNMKESDIQDISYKPESFRKIVNPEDKVKRLSNNVSIWIDKCSKWKEMYFNLLEKQK